jgi:hypothetical protein
MANILLNKGGAGFSISRGETIERLVPISRELSRLNLYYRAAAEKVGHEEISAALDRHLRRSHMDVGKVAETVLSAGGVPYNATDLEPQNFVVEGSDSEMLESLLEKEQAYNQLLEEESRVDHQIRTQAILLNLRTDSQERMNYLRQTLRTVGLNV